jgi:hypothetical protein
MLVVFVQFEQLIVRSYVIARGAVAPLKEKTLTTLIYNDPKKRS